MGYRIYTPDLSGVVIMVQQRSRMCLAMLSDVLHPHESEVANQIARDATAPCFELPKELYVCNGHEFGREPLYLSRCFLPPGFVAGCVFGPGTLPTRLFHNLPAEWPPLWQRNLEITPPLFLGMWDPEMDPRAQLVPLASYVRYLESLPMDPLLQAALQGKSQTEHFLDQLKMMGMPDLPRFGELFSTRRIIIDHYNDEELESVPDPNIMLEVEDDEDDDDDDDDFETGMWRPPRPIIYREDCTLYFGEEDSSSEDSDGEEADLNGTNEHFDEEKISTEELKNKIREEVEISQKLDSVVAKKIEENDKQEPPKKPFTFRDLCDKYFESEGKDLTEILRNFGKDPEKYLAAEQDKQKLLEIPKNLRDICNQFFPDEEEMVQPQVIKGEKKPLSSPETSKKKNQQQPMNHPQPKASCKENVQQSKAAHKKNHQQPEISPKEQQAKASQTENRKQSKAALKDSQQLSKAFNKMNQKQSEISHKENKQQQQQELEVSHKKNLQPPKDSHKMNHQQIQANPANENQQQGKKNKKVKKQKKVKKNKKQCKNNGKGRKVHTDEKAGGDEPRVPPINLEYFDGKLKPGDPKSPRKKEKRNKPNIIEKAQRIFYDENWEVELPKVPSHVLDICKQVIAEDDQQKTQEEAAKEAKEMQELINESKSAKSIEYLEIWDTLFPQQKKEKKAAKEPQQTFDNNDYLRDKKKRQELFKQEIPKMPDIYKILDQFFPEYNERNENTEGKYRESSAKYVEQDNDIMRPYMHPMFMKSPPETDFNLPNFKIDFVKMALKSDPMSEKCQPKSQKNKFLKVTKSAMKLKEKMSMGLPKNNLFLNDILNLREKGSNLKLEKKKEADLKKEQKTERVFFFQPPPNTASRTNMDKEITNIHKNAVPNIRPNEKNQQATQVRPQGGDAKAARNNRQAQKTSKDKQGRNAPAVVPTQASNATKKPDLKPKTELGKILTTKRRKMDQETSLAQVANLIPQALALSKDLPKVSDAVLTKRQGIMLKLRQRARQLRIIRAIRWIQEAYESEKQALKTVRNSKNSNAPAEEPVSHQVLIAQMDQILNVLEEYMTCEDKPRDLMTPLEKAVAKASDFVLTHIDATLNNMLKQLTKDQPEQLQHKHANDNVPPKEQHSHSQQQQPGAAKNKEQLVFLNEQQFNPNEGHAPKDEQPNLATGNATGSGSGSWIFKLSGNQQTINAILQSAQECGVRVEPVFVPATVELNVQLPQRRCRRPMAQVDRQLDTEATIDYASRYAQSLAYCRHQSCS
ncbi:hypothetical protein KR093_002874 [Drosophila rubida]|uniref:DM7 domain-containing protein n=1 Tax=Drosophila rubida TaxID=30044 RepID=A0AAD4K9M4_9MUSC|nr:hypothetical protein KR093_002874 [Drosophila rubida]